MNKSNGTYSNQTSYLQIYFLNDEYWQKIKINKQKSTHLFYEITKNRNLVAAFRLLRNKSLNRAHYGVILLKERLLGLGEMSGFRLCGEKQTDLDTEALQTIQVQLIYICWIWTVLKLNLSNNKLYNDTTTSSCQSLALTPCSTQIQNLRDVLLLVSLNDNCLIIIFGFHGLAYCFVWKF